MRRHKVGLRARLAGQQAASCPAGARPLPGPRSRDYSQTEASSPAISLPGREEEVGPAAGMAAAALCGERRGKVTVCAAPGLPSEYSFPMPLRQGAGPCGLLACRPWGRVLKEPQRMLHLSVPEPLHLGPKRSPVFAGGIKTKQVPPLCDSEGNRNRVAWPRGAETQAEPRASHGVAGSACCPSGHQVTEQESGHLQGSQLYREQRREASVSP